MYKKNQEGQILLIVVLTMIVALTVGLSIAARIVTELKISKQNEQSQRAFQAAQAGIDQALKDQLQQGSGNIGTSNSPIQLGNNASFNTSYSLENGAAVVLNNGQEVEQAVGSDVWMSTYPTFASPMGSGSPVTISMYWGTQNQICPSSGGANTPAAIEVVLLAGSSSSPTIQKYLYEANGCSRIPGADTSATSGSYTVLSVSGLRNWVTLPPITNGLIMKVIPIYNSSIIAFQVQSPPSPAGTIFPGQGSIITSTGNSGDTARKVMYFQSYPQLPLEVFPYSMLSQ